MLVKVVVVCFLYTVCAITLFCVSSFAPFEPVGVSRIANLHGTIAVFLNLSKVAGNLVSAAHTLWFVWLTASSAFIGPASHEPIHWWIVNLIVLSSIAVMFAFVKYAARRTPTDDELYENIFAITPAVVVCGLIGLFCTSSIGDEMASSVWRPQARTFVYWTFVIVLSLSIEAAKLDKINMATQLAFAATLIYCVIYMPVELALIFQAGIIVYAVMAYRKSGLEAVIGKVDY
jgi:hypothetical protein